MVRDAIRGLAASLLLCPLAHAEVQRAYLWADQPAAASYSPSAAYLSSSAGGASIQRTGSGRYRVALGAFLAAGGSGDGARGTVHVSAYGGAPTSCQVVSWSKEVNVACFDRAGTPVDSRFSLLALRGAAGDGVAYAWSGRPTEGSYVADRNYALGPSTGVAVTRIAAGRYSVSLGNEVATLGGNVQVSAYGATPRRCQVIRWSGGKVDVSCRDASGTPADSAFTVLAVKAPPSSRDVAYAWAGDGKTSGGFDTDYAFVPEGGSTTGITRAAAGKYSVRLGSRLHNVHVTGYGDDGTHCAVESWSVSAANVACFDAGGAPHDARFSVLAMNRESAASASPTPSAPTRPQVKGQPQVQSQVLVQAQLAAINAAPLNGTEHPFFKKMDRVAIESQLIAPPARAQPVLTAAVSVRKRAAQVRVGAGTIDITLEATPEVSDGMLDYLVANLGGFRVNVAARTDLEPFLGRRGELLKGAPEVRLPTVSGVMFTWPDGWEIARPHVLKLRDAYRRAAPRDTPPRSSGGVGVSVQALTGSWTQVNGQLMCQAPDDAQPEALPYVNVTINGTSRPADGAGSFSFTGTFSEVNKVTVQYDGRVQAMAGIAQGPRISVMNDFHNPRSEDIHNVGGTTSAGTSILQLTLPVLVSLDCELFQSGVKILQEYHDDTGQDPPAADDFRIKRWEGVDTVPGTMPNTPYAYYDYVVIANDFRRRTATRDSRFAVLTHEFGHTLRHAADGDLGHWGWDNFRWAYGRFHDGNEIANEQYAFNEGWGRYWECSRSSAPDPESCLDIAEAPRPSELDWNEKRIGERLLTMMSKLPGHPPVQRAAMQQLLRDNPGSIHAFRDYETRFCARFTSNTFCNAGAPKRTKRSCPTNYHDDGATCRFDNILAKNSYGRGVGTVPTGCGPGTNDAGLCYQPCRPGFDGVGPVCWRRCPAGMHDDGAFCRRDVDIRGSDNSRCPWYDVCGLTFERGCSRCPAGYQNDGCTCRIDAWIFAKETYGRGVGTVPTQCPTLQEYDAGLCYQRCRAGLSGVGPVCWDSCPEEYADHGATCYRDPQVIVKY